MQKYFRAYPVQNIYNFYDTRMENEVSGLISRYGKTEDGAIIYLFNPKMGHKIQTILRHQGRCKIVIVNLTDNREMNITQTYENDSTYAKVDVESGSGVLIRVTYVEDIKVENKPLLSTERLQI